MATNEEDQVIIQADLRENLLTAEGGDYTGRLRITGTVRNSNIAARIVNYRTEYRKETIENILNLADQEKVRALCQGRSVVDGVGQYLPLLKGNFIGEDAQFDPAKHSLSVTYTMGKALRDGLKEVKVQMNKATAGGPVINAVLDSSTRKLNEVISLPYPITIEGSSLKIMEEKADNGVFFVSEDEQTTKQAPVVVTNSPSALVVVPPADLADGMYYVEVRTHYAPNRPVKDIRTYRFPILLTVGAGGGSGEGGGDDVLE